MDFFFILYVFCFLSPTNIILQLISPKVFTCLFEIDLSCFTFLEKQIASNCHISVTSTSFIWDFVLELVIFDWTRLWIFGCSQELGLPLFHLFVMLGILIRFFLELIFEFFCNPMGFDLHFELASSLVDHHHIM